MGSRQVYHSEVRDIEKVEILLCSINILYVVNTVVDELYMV